MSSGAKKGHGKGEKSLDDIVREARGVPETTVDKAYEDFMKRVDPVSLDAQQANLIQPALDELYSTLIQGIEKHFKDDKHVDKKDEKKLKGAAIEGLKAFFKKAGAESSLEAIKGIEDQDQLYQRLVQMYQWHAGTQAAQSLMNTLESYIGNKDKKVGSLKNILYTLRGEHARMFREHLEEQHYNDTLANHFAPDVAKHLRKQLETKHGMQVDQRFDTYNHETLSDLYLKVLNNRFGPEGPARYGLSPKPVGKEEKKGAHAEHKGH